jgi:hypothetical protein
MLKVPVSSPQRRLFACLVVVGAVVAASVVASVDESQVVADHECDATFDPCPPGADPPRYTAAGPDRAADTRGGARVAADATLTVPVGSQYAGQSISVNLTVPGALAPGFATLYACDQPRPGTSSLNYQAGQAIANGVITKVSAQGTVCVYVNQSAHVVLDVFGEFPSEPPSTPVPVAPPPSTSVPVPPLDDDYAYMYDFDDPRAPYSHVGVSALGWNPCRPISYAVHAKFGTAQDLVTLNEAIKWIEAASGFDFQYVGEATGSLSLAGGIDAPAGAMAVLGFSNDTQSPNMAGGVVGLGGAGGTANLELGGDGKLYLVKGGFAIADVDDLGSGDELLSTLMHEMGHMVGLAHVNAPGELMQPVLSNPPQTTYGNGDLNGMYSLGQPQCSGSGALQHPTTTPLPSINVWAASSSAPVAD